MGTPMGGRQETSTAVFTASIQASVPASSGFTSSNVDGGVQFVVTAQSSCGSPSRHRAKRPRVYRRLQVLANSPPLLCHTSTPPFNGLSLHASPGPLLT